MPCRGCVSSFGLELIGYSRTTAAKLLGLYLTNGGTPTLDQDQRTDTSALVGHESKKVETGKIQRKNEIGRGFGKSHRPGERARAPR